MSGWHGFFTLLFLGIIMFVAVIAILVPFAKWNGWKDGSYLNRDK